MTPRSRIGTFSQGGTHRQVPVANAADARGVCLVGWDWQIFSVFGHAQAKGHFFEQVWFYHGRLCTSSAQQIPATNETERGGGAV